MPRTFVSPKPTSPRSQSADKLDFYPPVKDRIAQAQATMKPKEKRSSPGSISRRNSAPLLSSPKKPRVKPIDTSSTSISYHRPGLTPASRLTSPVGQLSTFGTVYIPSWDNSRSGSATSVPRPSTAPLPTDSGLSGDEQEDEELLGGVHYSTYGGRTSVIYDSDTASPRQLYDGPFADVCVPVPDELKAQVEKNELARAEREREKEKGHKRRGSQVTAALLRKVGVESPPPEEDKDHQPRLRKRTLSSIMLPSALSQSQSSAPTSPPPIAAHPASQSHVTLGTGTEQTHGTTSQEDTTLISMSKFPMPPVESVPPTPGSMSTVMPGTPALPGARPTTPAVPDFLVASRSATPGPANTPTEGESSSSEAKPKLRTRASLLALAMRRDSSSGSPKMQSADSPKAEPGSVESSNFKPETPNTSRPDPPNTSRPDPPNTSKSDPRRRSMLERLAARLAGPSALGQDESWVDESFTSDLEDSEDLRRDRERVVSPVLDFDLPSEPLIDLEQFGMMLGSSSPVRDRVQASATFPPTGMRTTSASSPRVRTTSAGSPPSSPPFPRIRTLSKLSTTGRKVLNKLEGRPSNRRSMSVFSTGSRSSRKSRKKHRVSGESTRGRLGSITRRASADMLSAEGAVEGTVMYGVGEEMLRLMFGEGPSPIPSELASPERERERTRSLPRRVSTPKRPVPRGDLVAARVHAVESENKAPGDVGLLPPDFGGSLDLRFSNPMANPPLTQPAQPTQPAAPLQPTGAPAPRRKGHRRGTASASKENVSIRPKSPVQLKSRTRSKSAPLGLSPELSKSLDAKPAVGILTNGGSGSGRTTPNLARGRVVIVNSATTPSFGAAMNTGTGAGAGAATPRRQTTRSNPLAPAAAAAGNTSTGSQNLTQPGVVVTAPTPPAPRRSMSMPLDGMGEVPKVPDSTETPRGTMSRGTSVQFVPESYEGRRSGKRRERPSSLISSGPPVLEVLGNGSGNGNGKRKVEREPTDAADASMSSPFKKPKLSEEMDITFMGEPLFGGRPQHKRGVGSVDRASSHHSTYSRHSQSYRAPYPYPTPTTSPDPERASIPIHAIVTPRVQSLYGTGSEYASRRQSISSIPRPKSRASARSNATGRRSNMTGARSARSNRTSGSGKLGPRSWRDRLPMSGWCFLIGFLVPFAWWYAAFARAERGYYGGGVWSREVESQWEGVRTDVHRDDGRIDAHTWRFRCRLMAAVSIVVYVPVIVLAAVFA